MGKILDLARNTANMILTSFGFESDITLIKDNLTVTIQGLALVHHLSFDTENQTVNSKNAHITVSESSLIAVNFPYRNAKNEVFLRGILVSFEDSNGISKTYIVKENFADETLGTIVLNLGLYVE